MIAHAKRLTKSKFARNVAIVASGTAGAQAITMAFSPIITRLYGPEAFGVLGTFTAILAVLTPLAALSYPIAIVLPKRDSDALGLANLSLGIAVVMSLLAAMILTLFKAPIVNVFNLEAVESFILLLPLAMLFTAAMAVMSQWVIRKKLFKIKAKVAVLQALWLNLAKAGIGLLSPLSAVLVVLATAGSLIHALMLWVWVRKRTNSLIIKCDVKSLLLGNRYVDLAGRYRDFAYYRTPQNVLNAVSQSIPILMLASFFGPAAAGFYALSKMVLGVPTELVGKSISSVFYPRFNEAVQNKENHFELLIKVTLSLALVGLLPFSLLIVFGPWIFSALFGSEWHVAGEYAQWMAIWAYFGFLNSPSVSAIQVLSLNKFFLLYEVFSVAGRASFMAIGCIVFESDFTAVALFSISAALFNALLVVIVMIACKKNQMEGLI